MVDWLNFVAIYLESAHCWKMRPKEIWYGPHDSKYK